MYTMADLITVPLLQKHYEETKKVFAFKKDVVEEFATQNETIIEHGNTIEKHDVALDTHTNEINALQKLNNGITYWSETDNGVKSELTVPKNSVGFRVNSVGGKSLVVNQNFSFNMGYIGYVSCKGAISEKIVTLTELQKTMSVGFFNNYYKPITNHLYYCSCDILTSVPNVKVNRIRLEQGTLIEQKSVDVPTNVLYKYSSIFKASNNTSAFIFYFDLTNFNGGTTDKISISNNQIVDLTQSFGETVANALTIDVVEKILPYIPYTPPTVTHFGVDEFVGKSKNVLPLENVHSSYVNNYSVDGCTVRMKNNTGANVYPQTEFTLLDAGTYTITKDIYHWTDVTYIQIGDKNDYSHSIAGFDASYTFTLTQPTQCRYLWSIRDGADITFNIQCTKDNKADTEYIPYFEKHFPIPQAVKDLDGYGWSVGDVCNEVDFANSKFIKRVERVDLGSFNWIAGTNSTFNVSFSKFKTKNDYNVADNLLCGNYENMSRAGLFNKNTTKGIATQLNTLFVRDTKYSTVTELKNGLQGEYLYYELAEPIITDISDLLQPYEEIQNVKTIEIKTVNDYNVSVPYNVTYDIDYGERNKELMEQIETNKDDIVSLKKKNESLQRQVNILKASTEGIAWVGENDDTESYTKVNPLGAKGLELKSVGGKSLVVNQLVDITKKFTINQGASGYVIDGNNIVCTSNGATGQSIGIYQAFDVITNHLYYVSCKVNVSKNTKIRALGLENSNGCLIYNKPLVSANIDTFFDSVQIANTTTRSACVVYFDNAESGYVSGDKFSIKDFMCVDLTAMFGQGNEPSAEEFRKIFTNYIPYTPPTIKSIACNNVKVQGKNLCDGVVFLGGINSGRPYKSNTRDTPISSPFTTNNEYMGYIFVFKAKAGFTYSFSSKSKNTYGNGMKFWGLYDKLEDIISTSKIIQTGSGNTFTPTKDGIGIVSEVAQARNTVIEWSNLQLEISSAPTPYSPYNVQQFPIPQAIQQLDGYGWSAGDVYNEVDYANKQYIQRVGRVIVNGGTNEYWGVTGANTEIRAFISNVVNKKQNGKAICVGWDFGLANNLNEFDTQTDYIRFNVYNKATSVTEWRNYLTQNPITIYYELATPIVTDISDLLQDFDNTFECEGNGTITFENTLGEDYRVPIPNEVEYIVKVGDAL